jgi:tRNA-splicing ligase RtcB
MNVPPAVVDEDSEIGRRYIAAMELAGRYAYAGREWVVERVRRIVGGTVTDSIHNHHNYAWRERHGDCYLDCSRLTTFLQLTFTCGYGSASLRERLYCKSALSPSQRMMAIPGSCLITGKSS